MYSLRNTYQAQNTCIGSACSEGTINKKISSKHPLNGLDLVQIFTGNSVSTIELNCICLTNSRAIFGISVFRGVDLVCPPSWGVISGISYCGQSGALMEFQTCFDQKWGHFRHIWSITCLNTNYLTRILLLKWCKIHVNQPKWVVNVGL